MTAVRRLGPDDAALWRAVRLEALEREPAAFVASYADAAARPIEAFRKDLSQGRVFAAFEGPEPLGCLGWQRLAAPRIAHRGFVFAVYLRAENRGSGLADGMIEAALDDAAEDGVLQLELNVTLPNPRAVGFYRRHGFSEIGCIPGALAHDGAHLDQALFALRLVGGA